MMWLGLVMMVLSAGAIYVYLQNKDSSKSSLQERNKAAIKKAEELKKSLPPKELDIKNLEVGGILRLEGVGLESQDFDLQVKARHICKMGTHRWLEFEGDSGSRNLSVTVDGGDISVTLKSLGLGDIGMAQQDLDQLGSESEPITYDSQTFFPEKAGVATYCAHGNELEPENYEFWEYETKDGTGYLSVSRWSDGEVEVGFSVPIPSSQVTVYSLR